MDIELQGVEGDEGRVLGNVQINDDGTVKSQLVEVGLERNMIMARDDIGGKQLPAMGATRSSTASGLVDTSLSSAHLV